MGVMLTYDKDTFQVIAQSVGADSAAETAGIEAGDIYLEVDNISIVDINDVFDILAVKKPHDVITVKLSRDGAIKEIEVILAAIPE
jgi:S1-C subfamily serine protease